jgi:hypothetical protein
MPFFKSVSQRIKFIPNIPKVYSISWHNLGKLGINGDKLGKKVEK